MSEHQWDEDVEKVVNCYRIGNPDNHEVVFKQPVDAFIIYKDDVIYLAKQLGLTVYEKDSAL